MIGIIAILISIMLPALNRVRQSATWIKCRANLSQMGLALVMYANENRDHFPSPQACETSDTVTTPFVGLNAYAYRRGIGEADTLGNVETLGLPNLLHRLKYLVAPKVWLCPSRGGRNSEIESNTYAWQISPTNSKYTTKQRSKPPISTSTGLPSEKDWWYVQDSVYFAVRASNSQSTSTTPSFFGATALNWWYMPHQYRGRRVNAQSNSARQGSTNVLFQDGSVGMFVYTPTSGFSPAEIIRGN